MPTHTVDTSEAAVGLLPLTQPAAAACAKTITDITDTLVVWDDGTLDTLEELLPRGIIRTQPRGQLIIKGKPGRPTPGLTDLKWLQALQSVGGLSIYNMDGLTDLRGLEQLTNITGDLIVSENDNLRNMTGLDSLTSVSGDVLIVSNMNLRTLDGLGALRNINRHLLLKGNGYVMNSDALTSLRRVGGTVTLTNNGATQLALPPGVAVGPNAQVTDTPVASTEGGGTPGGLIVVYGTPQPPSVDDVQGACDAFMPPLSKFDISVQRTRFHSASKPLPTGPGGTVQSNVVVYDDGSIPELRTSLGGVTSIAGSLLILGGPAMDLAPTGPGLATLDGLQQLTEVGELGVVGATQLKDFSGLDNLDTLNGNLVVLFCDQLTSLAGLGANAGLPAIDLTALPRGLKQVPPTLPGAAGGGGAAAGADVAPAAAAGADVATPGEPAAASLPAGGADVAVAAPGATSAPLPRPRATSATPGGLRKVRSEVWLQGNPRLASLAGFEALEEIEWRFNIRDCDALTDLDALGSLQRVGGSMIITDCAALNSTAGLTSLTDIGVSIAWMWNSALQDVQGLAGLTQLPGDLVVAGSPQLTTLAPLKKLVGVGLNLVLDTTGLTSCAGLEGLQVVGGVLTLSGNPQLTSLQGLSSLKHVGDDVAIRDNRQLTSLATLDTALETVGGGVYVEDNPGLNTLAALPRTLKAVAGTVQVRRNGPIPASEVNALQGLVTSAPVFKTGDLQARLPTLVNVAGPSGATTNVTALGVARVVSAFGL